MILKAFSKLFKKRASAWDAAGNGKRLTYWQTENSSINNLLGHSLEILRSRSRDMVRKNPYAANIIETLVTNAIGTGIKPQTKNKSIQELWLRWTDEADSQGVLDFYGLQALVCRSMIEGGECFVRFCINRNNSSVPLQLQILESEHLDTRGIEFNKLGQRKAYYLFAEHPNEGFSRSESIRVPASEVLHIYKPLRPGQIRGEPWLSRVLLKLHELDQYDDAELVRKKTAAMFAGFITRLDPESNVVGSSNEYAGLEPGTMQLLEPGEDVKFSNPTDVGSNYEAFMRQQLRAIAVGMGITYEQLTGDLSNVNYSSIRAGLIEFRRRCSALQHNIIVFQLCRPVWNRWIELALLSSKLTDTSVNDVKWVPQGFDWVDPLKDQKAQQMAVRNGFKSRSEVISELGYDAEQIDQEIKEDNERADRAGFILDSDSRHGIK